MRLLLDTQLLLWAIAEPTKISASARKLLNDPASDLCYSVASLWEIAIKNSLGREDFRIDPRLIRRGLLDNGYVELPITGLHAITVNELPTLHKDPFDRLLVAQAQAEGVLLLTTDSTLARYPGSIRKV
jgi:PIN domain nuclease of toxin-antitoxin system